MQRMVSGPLLLIIDARDKIKHFMFNTSENEFLLEMFIDQDIGDCDRAAKVAEDTIKKDGFYAKCWVEKNEEKNMMVIYTYIDLLLV